MQRSNITEPVILILFLLAFFIVLGMIDPLGGLNASWYSIAMAGGFMVLPPVWLILAVLISYLFIGLPWELRSEKISDKHFLSEAKLSTRYSTPKSTLIGVIRDEGRLSVFNRPVTPKSTLI